LEYFKYDPVHRSHHHDKLTFGLMYAFSENFLLPFSHDEVVHGKGSLINKMAGDEWQRFANLKALYTFMFTYPGKKLLFMGCEFGQTNEWNHDTELPWHLLDHAPHQGIQKLIQDLNALYKRLPALHNNDFSGEGFHWIDCEDSDHSIISYIRKHDGKNILVILNFTPVPRNGYVLGCPTEGQFKEVLNSDSSFYGGENIGNHGVIYANPSPYAGFPFSLNVNIPPLGGLILEPCES